MAARRLDVCCIDYTPTGFNSEEEHMEPQQSHCGALEKGHPQTFPNYCSMCGKLWCNACAVLLLRILASHNQGNVALA